MDWEIRFITSGGGGGGSSVGGGGISISDKLGGGVGGGELGAGGGEKPGLPDALTLEPPPMRDWVAWALRVAASERNFSNQAGGGVVDDGFPGVVAVGVLDVVGRMVRRVGVAVGLFAAAAFI